MGGPAITYSASTWQQPLPSAASPARTALLDRLATVVAGTSGRATVVVDGRTGSGKTSFGHELATALVRLDRPVLRASLDDFKRPWADRRRYDRESGEGYYRNAFDTAAVRRLLLDPFARGEPVALCSIDPLTQLDHSSETVRPAGDAVLVVDGVFALRPELAEAWNVAVWLEVDAATALARGVARDRDRVGPGAEALHLDRYRGAEEIYLAECRPVARADVVVDNTELAAPSLVRG